MKSITAFVIAAVAALLLTVVSVAGLNRACAGSDAGAVPVRYEHAPGLQGIEKALFVPGQAEARALPVALSAGWPRSFLCDMRASDVVLAAVALFLALTSFFQGLWMWRTMQAADRSARSSQAVEQAQRDAQRAYVVFKEFKLDVTRLSLIEDVQTCAIQPVWENAGATPTRNGRMHVNWRYFERAIPADLDLSDVDEMGNRIASYDQYAPLVIGPKSTSFSSVILLDASTLRMVREKQGRVLIWGWAEYDDVINPQTRHRTEFCYQLIVAGSPTHFIGFSQYPRFNGVDEDCERKPTALVRR